MPDFNNPAETTNCQNGWKKIIIHQRLLTAKFILNDEQDQKQCTQVNAYNNNNILITQRE